MAQIDFVEEHPPSQSVTDSNVAPAKTRNLDIPLVLPGISYIPDKIEVAEDQVLMSKLGREMLDFIRTLTQILDLMVLIKPKHLRTQKPIPFNVVQDMITNQGRGTKFRAYDHKVAEVNPCATNSVEQILRNATFIATPTTPRHEGRLKADQQAKIFPYANDLLEITGKKFRPLWHTVILEKPEELSIHKPKPKSLVKNRDSVIIKSHLSYQNCRTNDNLTRTNAETGQFTIKFAWAGNEELDMYSNPKLHHQMEMMIAANAGFRTVDEYKGYLSTLRSHWYDNFLRDAIKIGMVNCESIVKAFEQLAVHYDMNYNSMFLAKARLCLIVMSLPLWQIGRIETQRAVEFILEKILLLREKPLNDWLRVRDVPYVIFPPYTYEYLIAHSQLETPSETTVKGGQGNSTMHDEDGQLISQDNNEEDN